jgi:1-deoxy-D-xylulose-5-phosphate reductoisomerase
MIGVAVLGSTGSIGASTLDVLAQHPDEFRVVALTAHRNVAKLAQQVVQWRPDYAAVADANMARELTERLVKANAETRVLAGPEALTEIAALPEAQTVVAAIVGSAGLASTLAAARAGKRLLLANKESLVMAGSLLLAAVHASGATLIPVDSEHSAIFQCLPQGTRAGETPSGVRRVLLTASGGPFLDWPIEALAHATPEQACAHPNWVMGRKISVDSATLMNKGLELIEACILFGLAPEQVEIVVHRQSIVHSLVEYVDGSVLAQLGAPDMRTPIAHALAWPKRLTSGVEFLDLIRTARLDFCAPDAERFASLALAQAAARAGGLNPAILNAVNEVAVQAFLERRLNFLEIPAVSEAVLEGMASHTGAQILSLEEVLAADAQARERAAIEVSRVRTRGAHA